MPVDDNVPLSTQEQHLLLYVRGDQPVHQPALDEALQSSKEHLINWHRRARHVQLSCYNAAKWFDFWHFTIGAPLILLTAAAATSYYKTLVTQHHSFLGVPTEIVGLLLPVLAALQTFLGYGQRAEKFRTTAAKYGSLRREIEQGSSLSLSTRREAEKLMDRLRSDLDTLAREAPEAPAIVWQWTRYTKKNDTGSPLFQTVPNS